MTTKFGFTMWFAALGLALAGCSSSSTTTTSNPDSGAGPDATHPACTKASDCPLPTTSPKDCASAACDAVAGRCVYSAKDEDGDGHTAATCVATNGVTIETGDDCDDHDSSLYPNNPKPCSTNEDGGVPKGILCKQGEISCLADNSVSACTKTVACDHEACVSGQCESGCFIDGTLYSQGVTDPANPCEACETSKSNSAWTTLPDATSCGHGELCNAGQCGTECVIDNVMYKPSEPNPANPCQSCQPGTSVTDWTNLPAGRSCGAGDICNAGACSAGCYIGGAFHSQGALDPANPCAACESATSTSGWTTLADATACGDGQVCKGGQCGTQCIIDGATYMTGDPNPGNACESCQPGTSVTGWSDLPSGSPCGGGDVCNAGTCDAGCFISGAFYASATANPANPSCQACIPAMSTSDWSTSAADGTGCGSGEICSAGACVAGCYSGGTFYDPGAGTAQDAICATCEPAQSTQALTPATDGTACGAGAVCAGGFCATTFETAAAPGTLVPGVAQSYTVPAKVTQIHVVALGAAGAYAGIVGGNPTGYGGSIAAVVDVTPGETLGIYVGWEGGFDGGWNGGAAGGNSYGGVGGGASDVRRGGSALANRIVVAGGGGGKSEFSGEPGGNGGGFTGGAGSSCVPCTGAFGDGGGGGTASAGGLGGGSKMYPFDNGMDGALGVGGMGANSPAGGAGGGGGGYYGGGGGEGAGDGSSSDTVGGGGGGSSYAEPSATSVVTQTGVNSGNGKIIISY